MYIASPHNPRVRAWARLKTKRGRDERGLFLAEGLRLVRELLRSSLAVDAVLWNVANDRLPDDVADAASERGVPVCELSPAAFDAVSDTATPQGVIAVGVIPDGADTSAVSPGASRALLLDGIQDPGNVGTLLRTAHAFGVGEVCCASGTADPYAPKVVRASMGGLFHVSVRTGDGPDYVHAWRSRWPQGNVVLAAADAPEDVHGADLSVPVLIVVGSEAAGVSSAVAALATTRVRIPMAEHVDSLNAAVAGSIVMYESYTRWRGGKERQRL
ncbi:MAG: RNA methyltransferase [Alicyclobacillaceae bacterium]|nr:RNA methyltransferase [Alicyclobacillaceae bacterium]